MKKSTLPFILLIVLILSCSKEKKETVIGPVNTLRPLIVKTFKLFGDDKIDQYLDECFITRNEIETLLTKYEYDGSTNKKYIDDEYKDILNNMEIESYQINAVKKIYKFNVIFKNAKQIKILNEHKLDKQVLGKSSENDIIVRFIGRNNVKYKVDLSCIKTEERGWVMRGGLGFIKKIDK